MENNKKTCSTCKFLGCHNGYTFCTNKNNFQKQVLTNTEACEHHSEYK